MDLSTLQGFPHTGWILVGVVDVRFDEWSFEDYESCEYCSNERVRFIHELRHDAWDNVIRVGCVCAVHLTGDAIAPKRTERLKRKSAATIQRFISSGWSRNRAGGQTRTFDDYRVTVGQKREGFRVWVDGTEGRKFYPTEEQAKLAAFRFIEREKAQGIS